MKATLGQRPARIVGDLENELLLLLSEVAKFRVRSIGRGQQGKVEYAALHALPVLWTEYFRPLTLCPQITFQMISQAFSKLNNFIIL